MITGQHYIQGRWQGTPVASQTAFSPRRAQPLPYQFAEAGNDELEQVTQAAWQAFLQFQQVSSAQRAAFLQAIAEHLTANSSAICEMFVAESGLPEQRAQGELARTCAQLRFFAEQVLSQQPYREAAQPQRQPLAKPAMTNLQVPLGPVVVFAASNFPLAFSVAGGDTAAALAAGCPVIVKAHNAHPATSELAARAIAQAELQIGMPVGSFALVHARQHPFSERLIQHPLVKAVGFTGSINVGMHFQRLIQQRPEPIPFYGELGSQNPVLVLPQALAARGAEIGQQLAQSVLLGNGQFCTRPGLIFAVADAGFAAMVAAMTSAVQQAESQPLLTGKIADSYQYAIDTLCQLPGVQLLAQGHGDEFGCHRQARLLLTDGEAFASLPQLREEVFGPTTLLVRCRSVEQIRQLLALLAGQLTATVFHDSQDAQWLAQLQPALLLKVGRLVYNMVPTGVEVSAAMQHGGPFPASSDSRYSSVGGNSMARFSRPVCIQSPQ